MSTSMVNENPLVAGQAAMAAMVGASAEVAASVAGLWWAVADAQLEAAKTASRKAAERAEAKSWYRHPDSVAWDAFGMTGLAGFRAWPLADAYSVPFAWWRSVAPMSPMGMSWPAVAATQSPGMAFAQWPGMAFTPWKSWSAMAMGPAAWWVQQVTAGKQFGRVEDVFFPNASYRSSGGHASPLGVIANG